VPPDRVFLWRQRLSGGTSRPGRTGDPAVVRPGAGHVSFKKEMSGDRIRAGAGVLGGGQGLLPASSQRVHAGGPVSRRPGAKARQRQAARVRRPQARPCPQARGPAGLDPPSAIGRAPEVARGAFFCGWRIRNWCKIQCPSPPCGRPGPCVPGRDSGGVSGRRGRVLAGRLLSAVNGRPAAAASQYCKCRRDSGCMRQCIFRHCQNGNMVTATGGRGFAYGNGRPGRSLTPGCHDLMMIACQLAEVVHIFC